MRSDGDALWRILSTRRDHRHFHPTPVARETIERLLEVFAVAPSVGLSQPWHVTVVEDRAVRESIHSGFRAVRAAEAERFGGERRELYDSLRLEGILQAPVGLVVSHVPPPGPTLGTTSVPAARAGDHEVPWRTPKRDRPAARAKRYAFSAFLWALGILFLVPFAWMVSSLPMPARRRSKPASQCSSLSGSIR